MTLIKLPKPKHSNKPQNHIKFDKNDSNPLCLVPFIDKLVVIVEPASIEDGEFMFKQFWTYAKDEAQDLLTAKNTAKIRGFSYAMRLRLDGFDPKRWPLLHYQMDQVAKKVRRLRIEFVPHDLKAEGITQLSKRAVALVPYGWDYFAEHGRVSRIDIAVDIPGITMDSIWGLPTKAGETRLWKSNKGIETVVWGKTTGNQTTFYSRKAKREGHNQEWDGKADLRVERRLLGQKLPLKNLYELKNPLAGITISPVISAPPPDLPPSSQYIWSLFCDAAAVRSVKVALDLLSDGKRAMFRKHIKAKSYSWWKPDEIWKEWKPMIEQTGLLSAKP